MNDCYVAIWEFRVTSEYAAEFERVYVAGGTWEELFRSSPGFISTELVVDRVEAGRYLTIDRWVSLEAFLDFKEKFGKEYAALDRQCERFTKSETKIGEFTQVSPSPSAPGQQP